MKRLSVFIIACSLLFGATAMAQEVPHELTAEITNATGEVLGTATFATITTEMANDMTKNMGLPLEALDGAIAMWVQVKGLTPGFHGFHVHSVGTCDPSGERAFASAGGHFHAEGQTHGQHMGDLPSLLATESGVAVLVTTTDRFRLEDLMDEDGSAVIIHAAADNFGNIPADRYDPDADEATLNTGDAGARQGCGVIKAAG